MTLPAWLLHAIADQTGDHTAGAAHAARLLECPRCASPVVAGLDNPQAALEVHAQPWEVDPAGEALALLLGLGTHHLLHTQKRWEIARRGIDALKQNSRRLPVLVDHHCSIRVPPSSSPILAARTAWTYPVDPPF